MSTLTPIDRSAIQVGMIILHIHDGYIDSGKVIEVSPQLKMARCNDHYGIATAIHRIYIYPTRTKPSEGIYLCPGEIADRLVFSNLPTRIKIISEEQQS